MNRLPFLLLAALAASCGKGRAAPVASRPVPQGGVVVEAGQKLQAIVDAAQDGAVLTLADGAHRGPVVVDRGITLQGKVTACIEGGGSGSTVTLRGKASKLLGCTIRGSGDRLDTQDSAVHVEGEAIVVEGVRIEGALFGVLVHKSNAVVIRDNLILGNGAEAMGLRGDGIRLWETRGSEVSGNFVRDHRDVVVWYSPNNRVTGNHVERCRYGTHYMFSHDNVVEDNVYLDDVVGIFVMYSHDLAIRRNLLARASGSAGIGLGVKESGNLRVEDNWFVQDTTGIYLDTSPLDPQHHDWFRGNVIRLCDTALHLHAKTPRNDFRDNLFADNGAVIAVGGEGDALSCVFEGNYYDVYQGYDLDGDGFGDVPFELRRLSSQMESRYPDLALLHGAPVMAAVDMMSQLVPLFAPRTLMRDSRPRLDEPSPVFVPAPILEAERHAR